MGEGCECMCGRHRLSFLPRVQNTQGPRTAKVAMLLLSPRGSNSFRVEVHTVSVDLSGLLSCSIETSLCVKNKLLEEKFILYHLKQYVSNSQEYSIVYRALWLPFR